MFKRSRAATLMAAAALGVLAATGISAVPALAQACPNHSTRTVSGRALSIVGIGRFTANVTVNGNATNLFFRLIDKNTGDVVDLQTTPLRLDNLDLVDNGTGASAPKAQEIRVNLAGVSYVLPKGDTLELQVSTNSNSYVPNRGAAEVSIADGKVSVPVL